MEVDWPVRLGGAAGANRSSEGAKGHLQKVSTSAVTRSLTTTSAADAANRAKEAPSNGGRSSGGGGGDDDGGGDERVAHYRGMGRHSCSAPLTQVQLLHPDPLAVVIFTME